MSINNCDICDDPYLYRVTQPTTSCSSSCAKTGTNHPFYGKTFSKEHRDKISKSGKGRKFSKKSRMKISRAHKNKGYNKYGKDAKNYKGGVTKSNLPLYDTYSSRLDWLEEVRRDPDNKHLLQVRCTNSECRKWFTPKRTNVCDRINSLKFDYLQGESRLYCSDKCKQTCNIYGQIIYPRNFIGSNKKYTSYELRIWRHEVLKRENYICEYCGAVATDAHHERPKKLEPHFALDPDNGVACCEKCHYKYGHVGDCSTASLAKRVC